MGRAVAPHIYRAGAVDGRQGFDGLYAAVSLTHSGEGVIVTDPLSITLLYRSETDDFVAFASSAGLAPRFAAPPGCEPQRDSLGVAWLPLLGYIVGDRTGFASNERGSARRSRRDRPELGLACATRER